MSDYLPEEAISEILRNLPIKTLVQCTSVCKSWRDLIKSPTFISSLLASTEAKDHRRRFLFIQLYGGGGECSLRSDDEEMEEFMREYPPGNHFSFDAMGSCNGLVFLRDYRHSLLWNPSIKKWVFLPVPSLGSHKCSKSAMGLGFDSSVNDFKVLKLVQFSDKSLVDLESFECEIYSLNSGSWRTVPAALPKLDEINPGAMPLVNGLLHCVASRRVEGDVSCNLILGFDVIHENFREIMLPESLRRAKYHCLSIIVSGDSKIVVVRVDDDFSGLVSEIWMMKEYGVVASWERQAITGERLDILRLLAFREKGGLIFATPGSDLLSWDPESNQIKKMESHIPVYDIFSYVESLVLLDRKNTERMPIMYECDANRTIIEEYASDEDFQQEAC